MSTEMKNYRDISGELLGFIEKSPSAYHAVKNLSDIFASAGYGELPENSEWSVKKGGKYFTTRNGSSIIAFSVPKKKIGGCSIVAAHSDSPTFKIKELNEIKVEGNYTKLNTEVYGGMIMSSWMDRPLSAAGRVIVKTKKGISSKLVNIDRELMIIPNLAIHMQRDINNGYKFNPQVDMLPLLGNEKASFADILAAELKVEKEDILSGDMFLYPRMKGCFLGADGEYIASPRLDDLQCAFSAAKAMLSSDEKSSRLKVCAVFDNEEVGSGTKQGAASSFLMDVLSRANTALGGSNEDYLRMLSSGFMVSADNAHAVHPNFPEKTDQSNRNYINKGPVIKFNANQKYTTDSVSAAIFKLICEKNRVPYQIFHNRSDMPGGSTLGNISNHHVSLNTVDIGIPQLSMHSACETAGVMDTGYTIEAMRAFYNTDIECSAPGEYKIV